MGMTIGATSKVAVTSAAAAAWENTYDVAIEVRLKGDVAFHVAMGPLANIAATADDMYISIYDDVCLSVGVGQSLSFLGDEEGDVWVTEIKKS